MKPLLFPANTTVQVDHGFLVLVTDVMCRGRGVTARCPVLHHPCRYNRKVKKRGRKTNRDRQYNASHGSEPEYRGSLSPSEVDPVVSVDIEAPCSSPSSGGGAERKHPLATPKGPQEIENVPRAPALLNNPPEPYSASDKGHGSVRGESLPSHDPAWPHFMSPTTFNASPSATTSHFSSRGSQRGETECRYPCISTLIPFLKGFLTATETCDLLDTYFADYENTSRLQCPYVLTTVIRKKSLLHASKPRNTSPALLATMLWAAAQTADSQIYHKPGSRERITNRLYSLALSHLKRRDMDSWHRVHGGWQLEDDSILDLDRSEWNKPWRIFECGPKPTVDDILTFALLTIVTSGGEFKADCLKWWNKTVSLVRHLGYNTERGISGDAQLHDDSLALIEEQEERRRGFWLIYILDRHLALSHNRPLHLPDSECQVLRPLPEDIWQDDDKFLLDAIPHRTFGPPVMISGTGLFDSFLPLMAILGDIIELRYRRHHPRIKLDDISATQNCIEKTLTECEQSILELSNANLTTSSIPAQASFTKKARLVIPYATYIIKVLHILLHGESWDAISMLEDDGDWISSDNFAQCASNSIAAAQSITDILAVDPELTYMPYLFGIYLFHGSFVILLFAERMPQIGPNASVEQACELIIRAHEVSIVTLSTEFQKAFRKAFRSILFNVRQPGVVEPELRPLCKEVLSRYRWTMGQKGLCL
ncbi:hypothetical protein V494_01909 [Pseudogymnoascus sp. VKM F-4513 (FW-928)]|nr:hypothetical protein V494_01909 [Pseudogymnoascus sp. VKM F-4513 (FW-928)]